MKKAEYICERPMQVTKKWNMGECMREKGQK